MRALIFLLACCLTLGAHAAEMYRWVDKDGKVHYTDSPPPRDVKKVEQKNLGDSSANIANLPYATRVAAQNHPVTLYSTNCGAACSQAKQHLAQRGVPYSLKDPSSAANAETLQKLVGAVHVPVLVVGKAKPLSGYDSAAWDSILDAAGYPRTKPYGYQEPKAEEQPAQGAAEKTQ